MVSLLSSRPIWTIVTPGAGLGTNRSVGDLVPAAPGLSAGPHGQGLRGGCGMGRWIWAGSPAAMASGMLCS